MKPVIDVSGLTKVFRLYRDPKDRLKEIILKRPFSREFTALKDISFSVGAGETLGIIGENGAGKSTLLKILTGVIMPTRGQVRVNGPITGLLELGTGFNAELSGLRNIYMNGLLLGMNKEQIDARLDEIVGFAELGDFIGEPIKTYSSGMLMRLGFSVAIHAAPAAFVVDEALSVGDAYFQQKCMTKIGQFKDGGGAIVFVSHDLNAVKVICDRALLLSHGEVVEAGDPESVINTYNMLLARKSKGEAIRLVTAGAQSSYGTFRADAETVEFLNEGGVDSRTFTSGEPVEVRVRVKARADLDNVVVGMLLRDRFGQNIFGTNSFHLGRTVAMRSGEVLIFRYSFPLNIGVGKYTLSIAVHRDESHVSECYQWIDNAVSFDVAGVRGGFFIGLSRLDVGLSVKPVIEDKVKTMMES